MIGYFVLGVFLFVLDRITKFAALSYCAERYTLNQFVSCELIYNRGMSWGLFHSSSNGLFMLISAIIAIITAVVLFYGIRQLRAGYSIVGETLVVAGSISNLVDRVWYHGVIDFIKLSYNGYVWPLFNVADIGIVVGVAIMLWEYYRS